MRLTQATLDISCTPVSVNHESKNHDSVCTTTASAALASAVMHLAALQHAERCHTNLLYWALTWFSCSRTLPIGSNWANMTVTSNALTRWGRVQGRTWASKAELLSRLTDGFRAQADLLERVRHTLPQQCRQLCQRQCHAGGLSLKSRQTASMPPDSRSRCRSALAGGQELPLRSRCRMRAV